MSKRVATLTHFESDAGGSRCWVILDPPYFGTEYAVVVTDVKRASTTVHKWFPDRGVAGKRHVAVLTGYLDVPYILASMKYRLHTLSPDCDCENCDLAHSLLVGVDT